MTGGAGFGYPDLRWCGLSSMKRQTRWWCWIKLSPYAERPVSGIGDVRL
ncbi:hypothetical protein KCP78_19790 [Salmonella enterica subsp. enterica]|nr:hypothetical protein KCP78_19790 [Salmonella enterica subsp. enterica]